MADYKFLAGLNAGSIPLVTRFQQRSIVIPGTDNRMRDPSSSNTNNVDNNPGNLPQCIYMENIMPSAEGVFSAAYADIQAQVGGENLFDEVFILRNEEEQTWFFSPAHGRNYVTATFGVAWASTDPLAGIPVAADVSIAYVNGITYVCYAGLALLEWNGTNFIDQSGALTGVAIADIKAICGSGSYLILGCTDLSVKWSSVVNPLDFVPSELTGAGSQIPVDVRGSIIALTTVSGGFIIHCLQNAVAAVFTNNAAQPWIFREVKNAGGIADRKQVSTDNNSGATYIYGTNGLQQLDLRTAENMFPDVTDFLAGKILETFNGTTSLLTISRLAANLFTKIAYISGRYVVISYGTELGTYNYALVYDKELHRWGKLKEDHVDCFSGYFEPRQSICLLRDNGAVKQVIMDKRTATAAGVLIMGRYQLSRSQQICSQELTLEVLDGSDSASVQIATNYNGTTLGELRTMVEFESTDNYRNFQAQIEGENISYIIRGSYSIASMLLTVTKGARY